MDQLLGHRARLLGSVRPTKFEPFVLPVRGPRTRSSIRGGAREFRRGNGDGRPLIPELCRIVSRDLVCVGLPLLGVRQRHPAGCRCRQDSKECRSFARTTPQIAARAANLAPGSRNRPFAKVGRVAATIGMRSAHLACSWSFRHIRLPRTRSVGRGVGLRAGFRGKRRRVGQAASGPPTAPEGARPDSKSAFRPLQFRAGHARNT